MNEGAAANLSQVSPRPTVAGEGDRNGQRTAPSAAPSATGRTARRPLRFAVIGCGMLARSMHLPNLAAMPEAALELCCDLDEDALAKCRAGFGVARTTKDLREAVFDPDVDAICLATTEKLRLPAIRLAAEAGKPIYVEKPLARTLEEVYRIRSVVKASGIPFCVGHNRRSSPAMLEARRIFRGHMERPQPCAWRFDREGERRPRLPDDGVAGMSVRVNDDWHSWKAWVFDPQQAPHGPMLFEMTHFTDLCNWFLAAEPTEVVSLEHGMHNHGVVVRYRTGELATISMFTNGTLAYPKELYEAVGHGGVVAVDHMVEVRTAGIGGAPARLTYPLASDNQPDAGREGGLSGWIAKRRAACERAAAAGDPLLQFGVEPDKGHAHALRRFVAQIHGDGPEVCGINDAVLATEVAFAAIASAKARRAVSLDEVREHALSDPL